MTLLEAFEKYSDNTLLMRGEMHCCFPLYWLKELTKMVQLLKHFNPTIPTLPHMIKEIEATDWQVLN